MRSTLTASILPSARNGVGAMGKTPLAPAESMGSALVRMRPFDDDRLTALLASAGRTGQFRLARLRWGRNRWRGMRKEEAMNESRGSLPATAEAAPLPFDAKRLDALLDEAGMDAVVISSKHN